MTSIEDIKNDFFLQPIHTVKIENIIGDNDELLDLIRAGQQIATLVSVDLEDAKQESKLKSVDVSMRSLIDLENTIKDRSAAVRTITQRIGTGERVKDIPTTYTDMIIEKENAYKQLDEEQKYLKADKYVHFRQTIWNVNHPDEQMPPFVADNEDDDIIVSRTKLSLKCPLTTTWLEHPMTSTQCKHTFSKAAIEAILARRPIVPCPISGCPTVIRSTMLVYDEVMEDRVRRAKLRENQGQPDQQFYDVE